MVVDGNQMTRDWLLKRISKSNLKTAQIIICKSVGQAQNYNGEKSIDIVLARVDKQDLEKIEFIKSIHNKYLFSTVLAYGTYNDFNFLCKIMSNGVSLYLQDIYDEGKLNTFLNEAYERYCFIKLKLSSMVEKEKGRREKAYNSLMLKRFVVGFTKNSQTHCDKNVDEYIALVLDVMDHQPLHHSKSMVIELMIMLSEGAQRGRIKTDRALFGSKDLNLITKIKSVEELKGMVERYLKNLAVNIYLLSSASDYKSLMVISATNYIKNNYQKDISRDDVASAVSLNPSYFSKFFKEQTGESFVSYLRRIRLEEARSILENSDQPIKEVSERVGYTDSKYFSRLFYNHTGYTPCEYRKSVARLMA
jgi:YesN/AraC family two-component response regulator